ncbi:MAG: riboflavin kinase [Alistipes sp.]|nr:FMN adenylyltransferase [Rikenellaceae bacterium]MBP3496986.1 riboflavin kinase [Alistipes sp.]MBQ8853812.1 riboflavin kinase [Alistipes sp.]
MEGVEIVAVVVSGNQLGRKLGFPTANMDISDREDITNGVYRSQIEIEGVVYNAMSNVGIRPSVESKGRWLETHVFDFHGDLYGKRLAVKLLEKIRNERKFNSVVELRQQLEHDMEYCKEIVK